MERRMEHGSNERDTEFASFYEIERQLEAAERRYARAVEARDAAREECRQLSLVRAATPQAVMAARMRFDDMALQANRLRSLISSLEQRLDGIGGRELGHDD